MLIVAAAGPAGRPAGVDVDGRRQRLGQAPWALLPALSRAKPLLLKSERSAVARHAVRDGHGRRRRPAPPGLAAASQGRVGGGGAPPTQPCRGPLAPLLALIMKPRGRGRLPPAGVGRVGGAEAAGTQGGSGAPFPAQAAGEFGRGRGSRGRGPPKPGGAGRALFVAAYGLPAEVCLTWVDSRNSHSQIINKFSTTTSAFTRLFAEDLLGRFAAANGM